MNYYRRYVGSYLKKTSRLSMLEHGAYSVMLDYYYAENEPLPRDKMEIYRQCRAIGHDEQQAVDRILLKFFVLLSDGYHNERADEELGIATKVINTAKANGKHGGRPKKTRDESEWEPGGFPDEPDSEPENNPTGFENGSEKEPANNHPTTFNLQPSSDNQQPDKGNVGLAARRILQFLNEKAARRYQANRINLGFITARLRDGATESECRQVIAKKTREWNGNPKMVEYLRPATLFNATKFAQYQGELVKPPSNVSREPSED